jgi:hypothetical protein
MSKTYKELLAEQRELEARIEAARQAERDQAMTMRGVRKRRAGGGLA